ncbi:MAG: L-threonylcarbamoyladenylate synthase [Dehalococcoidia bacterium]
MSVPVAVDHELIERAAEVLRRGGLVAYPTDTVYGLAALPADDEAVRRLFAAKQRPIDKATPLLIASEEDVRLVAGAVSPTARRLMAAFWPGALTIILAAAQRYHSLAVGETVALRVPDHPVPRELCRLLGGPITGTSANTSGGPDPLTADDVRTQLGEAVDLVIDGGRCAGGRPSTVVVCTQEPPRIVREGAISREQIAKVAAIKIDT